MDVVAGPTAQVVDKELHHHVQYPQASSMTQTDKTTTYEAGHEKHAVQTIATSDTDGAPDRVVRSEAGGLESEDAFPEGGLRAWLVVLAAFLFMLPSLGLEVSIGTLQLYWSEHQLSEYSTASIGWIPSVFVYLSLALGLIVGSYIARYGLRHVVLIGSIIYTVMFFLLAQCKLYWQFMLVCGVLGGVGAAMLMNTSLAAVAHWFKARRGLAQGLVMMGSACGGLTIPLVLRHTFPTYGYAWSMRILGFMALGCFTVGNILIRGRIPPSSNATKSDLISLRTFTDWRLNLLAISVFCFEVTLFGALGLLPTYASRNTQYPVSTGFYLITVLNGVSCLGRVIPGFVADKMGRFNTLVVMLLLTLVFMLIIWLPFGERSLVALYAFAAIFGFGSGSWMSLAPACVGQLCRAEEFGRYYGSMYFVAGLATLICIPISGSLIDTVGAQAMVGFSCAVLALGALTCTLSRWACLGWQWKWMVKI